jgi:hypothetical protein
MTQNQLQRSSSFALKQKSPSFKEKVMNARKLCSVVFTAVAGCILLLPVAQASEGTHATKVTFSQPVEIPGQVLPAGTYWFEVTGDPFSPDFVRISSEDRKKIYATQLTNASERSRPARGTLFIFADQDSSQPEALLQWFFPGEKTGREFRYPSQEQKELAQDKHERVLAAPANGRQQSGL